MGLSAHFLGGTGPLPHPATQFRILSLGGRVEERAGNGIFKRTLSPIKAKAGVHLFVDKRMTAQYADDILAMPWQNERGEVVFIDGREVGQFRRGGKGQCNWGKVRAFSASSGFPNQLGTVPINLPREKIHHRHAGRRHDNGERAFGAFFTAARAGATVFRRQRQTARTFAPVTGQ